MNQRLDDRDLLDLLIRVHRAASRVAPWRIPYGMDADDVAQEAVLRALEAVHRDWFAEGPRVSRNAQAWHLVGLVIRQVADNRPERRPREASACRDPLVLARLPAPEVEDDPLDLLEEALAGVPLTPGEALCLRALHLPRTVTPRLLAAVRGERRGGGGMPARPDAETLALLATEPAHEHDEADHAAWVLCTTAPEPAPRADLASHRASVQRQARRGIRRVLEAPQGRQRCATAA